MSLAAVEVLDLEPDVIERCRICGCTDDDCGACIEKMGAPCYWLEDDLCSACAAGALQVDRDQLLAETVQLKAEREQLLVEVHVLQRKVAEKQDELNRCRGELGMATARRRK